MKGKGIAAAFILAAGFLRADASLRAAPERPVETRYLLFQLFTAAGSPDAALGGTMTLKETPDRAAIQAFAQGLKDRIGSSGNARRKLGFAVGPIALDHSDEQVVMLIRDAFAVARALDVAVALHLDDSMFWARNPALRRAQGHVEWIDWDGTESTGRRLDWGPSPTKVPPQLCFNSAPVLSVVRERGALIGREVARGSRSLEREGRGYLFAGVIAGWETMLGRDFDSGRPTGFCALANRGYSRERPPPDIAAERTAVVKEFMEAWAGALSEGGVPERRLYAHVGFTPQGVGSGQSDPPPGDALFGGRYRPGFSTYPSPGALAEILALVARHGTSPWASSEGTNVVPNGMPGEKTMETYLGRMFNHGAVLVNVFAWGVGPSDMGRNFFRRATEGADAIAAYRRFLSGQALREDPPKPFSLAAFREKLQVMQARLPGWVQRTGRREEAEIFSRRLDEQMKSGDLAAADATVQRMLALIASGSLDGDRER